jgi:hypothetical protein
VVGILQGSGTQLFGQLPSNTNILLDNIRANVAERFAEERKVIENTAKASSEAIDAESERYITVKAQVNNAKIAVENGQEGIKSIRDTLFAMRTTVALAGEQGEDKKFRSQEFDIKVNSINDEANRGGRAFNLIGNINRLDYTPNSIEYRSDLGAAQTTLTGTHAGSDYRIKANNGSYWIPELGTDSITHRSELQGPIQKTTLSDGTEIEKTASTRNAVKLVSYNEQTRDITIEVTFDPGLPVEVVTGKLERDGIGIMPAWFYNNLNTVADRQRAYAAIEKADIELTSKEATLSAAAAAVFRDNKKVDESLDRLTKDKGKVLNTQLDQTQELQIKAQQQIQAMQTNLESLSSQQANYLQAFAGAVRSPFLQISLKA